MDNLNVVVFNAGREEYGISVDYIISIEKLQKTTHVPHLQAYIKGVIHSRGQLIPLLDLANILYGEQIIEDAHTRIIVIQTDELSYGLLVQEAKEIIEIPQDKLQQVGLVAYHKTKYFSSIANLDERLITLIDPVSLLDVLEGIKEIKDYILELKREAQVTS